MIIEWITIVVDEIITIVIIDESILIIIDTVTLNLTTVNSDVLNEIRMVILDTRVDYRDRDTRRPFGSIPRGGSLDQSHPIQRGKTGVIRHNVGFYDVVWLTPKLDVRIREAKGLTRLGDLLLRSVDNLVAGGSSETSRTRGDYADSSLIQTCGELR